MSESVPHGAGILSLTASELSALRRTTVRSGRPAIQVTRLHNLAVIRRLLHEHGPQTRPALAKLSGLSLPTVGALVTELMADGMVEDRGVVAEARVGKPASLVAINGAGNAVVVLDLTHDDVFLGAIINLDGAVVDRVQVNIGSDHGQAAVDHALALAGLLIERSTANVIGIGVASPGLIDESGVVHVADRLRWRDVPLALSLETATDVPTVVSNDVNLVALGLSRFSARDGRDAIVIELDNGVGGAVLVGGSPVLGEQFAAGEIAHVVVDPGGELCACGMRGCLDMVAGAAHLERRRAAEGDRVLEPAGRKLGEVIAPIVLMLNINIVVVTGPAGLVEGPFAEGVRAGLHSRLRPTIAEGVEIEVGATDPDTVLRGALTSVLQAQLGTR